MKRFLSRMGRSLRKRWLSTVFRLRNLDGRVRKDGRLWLHVPLLCDGAGSVSLAAGISVGYGPAPILGDGTVRLQARGVDARIEVGEGTSFSNNVQVIAGESVKIGEYCLIGAGSVVIRSIPPGVIAAGNPAEVIRLL